MPRQARPLVRRLRALRLGSRRGFEQFYATAHDPYAFDSNPYETAKYDDLLQAAGEGPHGRALEVGCSIGTLTERLAPRCGQLLAVDIAQQAVDRTRARVEGHPNVVVERRTIPQELPDGPFDLIVCSDVLYYLQHRRLVLALERLAAGLAPGGAIVSLHWLGDHGAATSGHGVHDLQEQLWSGLDHTIAEHRQGVGPHAAGYRLDRYERR